MPGFRPLGEQTLGDPLSTVSISSSATLLLPTNTETFKAPATVTQAKTLAPVTNNLTITVRDTLVVSQTLPRLLLQEVLHDAYEIVSQVTLRMVTQNVVFNPIATIREAIVLPPITQHFRVTVTDKTSQNVTLPHITSPEVRQVHASQQLELPTTDISITAFWDQSPNKWGSKLIYPEATGLEKAMADVEADHLVPINAEIIKDIWDPFTIDSSLLPYLAWAMGVEFWNDQWSDDTKRSWVALQWLFKSMRGTAKALDMVVDYAGRDITPFGYKVTNIVTQPQKFFPSKSLTTAEREAWLATLPQVRVFFFVDTPDAPPRKAFFGGGGAVGGTARKRSSRFFLNYNFPIPSDAASHLERRATWNVNGVDTNTTVTDFGSYYQLHLRAPAGLKLYPGYRFFPGQGANNFPEPSDAWKRLVTIEPTSTQPWRIPVGPSLKAVQATPELITVQALRGDRAIVGSNLHHGGGMILGWRSFLTPSDAKYRIFERYPVYDPDVLPLLRPNPTFLGNQRLGWPAFTARVDVKMPSRISPWKFRVPGIIAQNKRFLIPHDPRPVAYVRTALMQGRRMADKLLLNTKLDPVFVAGGAPFIAGTDSYIVGQSTL